MNRSTACERCYFAKEVNSLEPCIFYIPQVIEDTKNIEIINGYYYLHNYICKYGISKNSAQNIITEHNIDIKEYAKNNVSIKYLLFILVDIGDDLEDICKNIKRLNIKPTKISLAFHHNYDVSNAQKICDDILKQNYSWKLHYFIEEKKHYEMLNVCISTDDRLASCDYILIVNNDTLKNDICDKDSINKINFIVNVQQPNTGILANNKTDYFFGIFSGIKNIQGIYSHVDNDIAAAIQNKYKETLEYYD